MPNMFTRPFTQHPAAIGESYLEHMAVAGSFAFWLVLAGCAAAVHAVVPALCEKTASNIILKLHERMTQRR
ncbi:MAG: DUF6356 family protein [Pseudomonadota bacterium]